MNNGTTNGQVSERALLARINRKLAHDGVSFHKFRDGTPYSNTIGRYYSVDDNNCITGPAGDDLEAIARDLGVLRSDEATP
jgi:hypothetical protein